MVEQALVQEKAQKDPEPASDHDVSQEVVEVKVPIAQHAEVDQKM